MLPWLAAGSAHCCVTSPPYFGLRDYDLPSSTWEDGWVGWLIGFWANRGSAQPAKRPSPWQVKYVGSVDNQLVWSQRARDRIAADVHRVSHWSIINASYDDAPVIKDATYFVDPPYVKKGTRYKYKDVDHAELGRWCFRQSFTNPVIACEQEGAAWLPFAPLATVKSTRGTSAEVSWTAGPVGSGLGSPWPLDRRLTI